MRDLRHAIDKAIKIITAPFCSDDSDSDSSRDNSDGCRAAEPQDFGVGVEVSVPEYGRAADARTQYETPIKLTEYEAPLDSEAHTETISDLQQWVRDEQPTIKTLEELFDPLQPDHYNRVDTLDRARLMYKKVNVASYRRRKEGVAVLIVPAGAMLVYPYDTNKLRTDYAITAAIYDGRRPRGTHTRKRKWACSWHEGDYTYKLGKLQTPNEPLDTDLSMTCRSGIHGYADLDAAKHHR